MNGFIVLSVIWPGFFRQSLPRHGFRELRLAGSCEMSFWFTSFGVIAPLCTWKLIGLLSWVDVWSFGAWFVLVPISSPWFVSIVTDSWFDRLPGGIRGSEGISLLKSPLSWKETTWSRSSISFNWFIKIPGIDSCNWFTCWSCTPTTVWATEIKDSSLFCPIWSPPSLLSKVAVSITWPSSKSLLATKSFCMSFDNLIIKIKRIGMKAWKKNRNFY